MVAIVSRAGWGAPTAIPAGRHVPPSSRHWFVVHWPGSAVGADERAVVRAIDASHRRPPNNWQVIGYNFLVGRSGTVFEGCGRDVRGIHSVPRNTDGWGVCVLVSVGETPPAAALNATRALYNWLNGVAGRTLNMSWHGQHMATQCAGPHLNAWVQAGMNVGVAPPPPTPPPTPTPNNGPPWPGRILRQPPIMRGEDVRTYQNRLRARGWTLAADGAFGPITEGATRQLQGLQTLAVDGRVGPVTWPAAWASNAAPPPPAPAPQPPPVPPWPGRLLRNTRPMMNGTDVRQWQSRMSQRGWAIGVDGWYGPQSEGVCREFQRRFGLQVDGIVGPITWNATWTR